jgi:hypothetical protein
VALSRTILPVFTGIAAGVVSSVLMAKLAVPAPEPSPSALQARERVSPRTSENDVRSRAVSSGPLPSPYGEPGPYPDAAGAEAPTPASVRPPPVPADMDRQVEESIDEIVQKHAAESVDSNWAAGTNSDFRHDLSSLGEKQGFALRSLDCRTTLCVAVLEWSSYEIAREYNDVSLFPYKHNCAITIYVPQPEHGDFKRAYQGKVLFDCSEERAAAAR